MGGLAGSVVECYGDGFEVVGGLGDRSVPLGKYGRSRLLVFSFVGRCQGECGSAKNTFVPGQVPGGGVGQTTV